MCRYGENECKHAECQKPAKVVDVSGNPIEFVNGRLMSQIRQNSNLNISVARLVKKVDEADISALASSLVNENEKERQGAALF